MEVLKLEGSIILLALKFSKIRNILPNLKLWTIAWSKDGREKELIGKWHKKKVKLLIICLFVFVCVCVFCSKTNIQQVEKDQKKKGF